MKRNPMMGPLAASRAVALAAIGASLAWRSVARAQSATTSGTATSRHWLSVAALVGSTQPDAKMADYQWDTSPAAAGEAN